MDEPALIHDAQSGDLDAFNRLVLAYQDVAFNTALRILGEDNLAADATQEAFISAFRGLTSFRGGSFRAWLLRTVTNACYDELRRRKRRPTVPLEPIAEDDEEIETPRWLADPGMSPEEQFDAEELEHAIQHCLNALPTDFRTVVVLADIQGLDYSDPAGHHQKPSCPRPPAAA
jgi:RNA polymerase sigma factor (sigma-70 family)